MSCSRRLCQRSSAAWILTVFACCGLAAPSRAEDPQSTPPTASRQVQSATYQYHGAYNAFFSDYVRTGQPRQIGPALAAAEKLLEVTRQVYGEKHESLVDRYGSLAQLHEHSDQLDAAGQYRQQAYELSRELHGEDSWKTADARLALEHVRRLAQLGEPQRKQLQRAWILNERVWLLWQRGQAEQAVPLARESVRIYGGILGEKNTHTLHALYNLAAQYDSLTDYVRAEPLYRRVLTLYLELFGRQHPQTALAWSNLGGMYQKIGDYDQALAMLRQANTAFAETVGKLDSDYAQSCNKLGALYAELGDCDRAEPLLREALAIRTKVLGPSHPATAATLTNLAHLYVARADAVWTAPGEPAAQDRARAAEGFYLKAKEFQLQALRISEARWGKEHFSTAGALNNLAFVYQYLGDSPQAEQSFLETLEIKRRVWGSQHPDTALSEHNLAAFYLATGEYDRARQHAERASAIYQDHLQETFTILSQRQRLDWLARLRNSLDLYLCVGAKAGISAGELYRHVLFWKGILAARRVEERIAHDVPQLQELIGSLNAARAQLAQTVLTPARPGLQKSRGQRIEMLRKRREELESELATQSAVFRRERQLRELKVQDVMAALPPDVVFCDFLVHLVGSPPQSGKGPLKLQRRLAAFVMRSGRPPVHVDLGPIRAIGDAVDTWREALAEKPTVLDQAGRNIKKLVWQPLAPHLDGVKVVLVAPDGPLGRLPLAALPGVQHDTYLIEDVAIGYVTSGRHVLEIFSEAAPAPARGMLAVGHVDYDATGAAGPLPGVAPSRQAPVDEQVRARWTDLPGTRLEVEAVVRQFAKAFPQEPAMLLTRAEPSEGRVREELTQPRRYLHLACHGFFASPQVMSALRPPSPHIAAADLSQPSGQLQAALGHSPMLLSGVALAGSRRSGEGDDVAAMVEDGILTAEEVAGMDLRGTDLVVLSACQSGLGPVAGGEGVLGLQRAFQVAGARSVVASVWRVDDAATSLLMEEFYKNLWQQKWPRLEALQRAQLAVLKHPERVEARWEKLGKQATDRGIKLDPRPLPAVVTDAGRRSSHPALWGAFLLSGDWR